MLLLRKLVSHTYAAITYCSLLIVCNFLAEVKQTFNNKPWWFQIKTQISFYSHLPKKKLKKWLKNLNQSQTTYLYLVNFWSEEIKPIYNEIREEHISIIICDFLNYSYNQLFFPPTQWHFLQIVYPYCRSSILWYFLWRFRKIPFLKEFSYFGFQYW